MTLEKPQLAEGLWAVARGYGGRLAPNIWRIASVTNKLVKYERFAGHYRQVNKDDVMATFATEEEAQRCRDAIAGINGERTRRIDAANTAAYAALDKLISRQNEEKAS